MMLVERHEEGAAMLGVVVLVSSLAHGRFPARRVIAGRCLRSRRWSGGRGRLGRGGRYVLGLRGRGRGSGRLAIRSIALASNASHREENQNRNQNALACCHAHSDETAAFGTRLE